MAWDPLAPKRLAAAIALCGLSYMMVESTPHWGSIGVGLGSLAAFGILCLAPALRMRVSGAASRPVSPAAVFRPERRRERLLPPHEPPHRLLNSQPLVFKALRDRRRRRD